MDSIRNSNLCEMINFVQNYGEKIPDIYLGFLYSELSVSTVICPSTDDNAFQLMCSVFNQDDMFVPAFTSLDKYSEFFSNNEFEPMTVEFEEILRSFDENVVTGVMINPATDNFFISGDELDNIPIFDFPNFETNNSKKQYKKFLDNIGNQDLFKGFESDDFLVKNGKFDTVSFEKLLKRLENSVLFFMVTSPIKIKRKSKDGIYRRNQIEAPGYYILNNHDHSRILVFDSKKAAELEHSHKCIDNEFFIMTTSFVSIVEDVLKGDIDSIIFNHSTNPIFIPRDLLLLEIDKILSMEYNSDFDSFKDFYISID